MERFKMIVNGVPYTVEKGEKGTVMTTEVPDKYNPDAKVSKEISRVKDGWKLVSVNSLRSNYSTTTILRFNGEIAIINSFAKPGEEPEVLKEKFNCRKRDNLSPAQKDALDIFTAVSRLRPKNNLDFIPDDVIDVRVKFLESIVDLLGVDRNMNFVPEMSCLALSDIGKMLEDYDPLSAVKKDAKSPKGYIADVTRIGNKEDFMRAYKQLKERTQENFDYKDSEDDYNFKIQSMDGVTSRLESTLSEEELGMYAAACKVAAKMIFALNGDLFTKEHLANWGIKDLSILNKEQRLDYLSRLIDSLGFSKACEIENKFVIKQSSDVVRWVEGQMQPGDTSDSKSNEFLMTQLRLLGRTAESKRQVREAKLALVQKTIGTIAKNKRKEQIKKRTKEQEDEEYTD